MIRYLRKDFYRVSFGHISHLLFLFIFLGLCVNSYALNLIVLGVDNSTQPPTQSPVNNYRWLIEEDVTHKVIPKTTCEGANESGCLSIDFHRSHMPVVAQGVASDPLPILDPAKIILFLSCQFWGSVWAVHPF